MGEEFKDLKVHEGEKNDLVDLANRSSRTISQTLRRCLRAYKILQKEGRLQELERWQGLVRCGKCERTFKRAKGKSWRKGICAECDLGVETGSRFKEREKPTHIPKHHRCCKKCGGTMRALYHRTPYTQYKNANAVKCEICNIIEVLDKKIKVIIPSWTNHWRCIRKWNGYQYFAVNMEMSVFIVKIFSPSLYIRERPTVSFPECLIILTTTMKTISSRT